MTLDHRGRIAVGSFARHEMYLLTVDEHNVITLTPADVVPVPVAPIKQSARKRAPQKKASAAVGETPRRAGAAMQEQP